ncbi:MAG: hypothetical protein OER82_05440 [Nitrosopumilus sp.]|nr:hypothetical protein [Nitrosopumilus sp.]
MLCFETNLLGLTEHQDTEVLLSRIFISIAYATGGFYALLKKVIFENLVHHKELENSVLSICLKKQITHSMSGL